MRRNAFFTHEIKLDRPNPPDLQVRIQRDRTGRGFMFFLRIFGRLRTGRRFLTEAQALEAAEKMALGVMREADEYNGATNAQIRCDFNYRPSFTELAPKPY